MTAAAESVAAYDRLFFAYMAVGVTVTVLVFCWMAYLLIRYRRRKGDDAGDDGPAGPGDSGGRSLTTLIITAAIGFTLTAATFGTLDFLDKPPEEATGFVVEVQAFQFGWRFVYPNNTSATEDLRVPVGKAVLLRVTSLDVMHSFAIPDFKLKIDAIPGRVNSLWFRAEEPGEYPIRCMELCGTGHAHMQGAVVAMTPDGFAQWYGGTG